MGPHNVPCGRELSSQSCNGGSLKTQMTNGPADRPHTRTCPGNAHRVVVIDEGHDMAGLFAACTSAFVPPDPHRDNDPERVVHRLHHAPEASCEHPKTRVPNQLVARLNIEHQGLWGASHAHQMKALQTDKQITAITTIKRCRAVARVRHHPRFVNAAGIAARSSSRTSNATYNPRPALGHPHTTRKSKNSDGGVKIWS